MRSSTKTEEVVLVDGNDDAIGTMEKMEAHRLGKLHRAFSIFIFDSEGRVLLQQRAHTKYHSPGLWSNACCSHPRPDEDVLSAAHRRHKEELGIICELQERFAFTYHAQLANGLQEHEFDHVLSGTFDGPVFPDPEEVSGTRWLAPAALDAEIAAAPGTFTPWLLICWEQARTHAGRDTPDGSSSPGPSHCG